MDQGRIRRKDIRIKIKQAGHLVQCAGQPDLQDLQNKVDKLNSANKADCVKGGYSGRKLQCQRLCV